jgi:glycine betaine/proline transport system substrate-binding protein
VAAPNHQQFLVEEGDDVRLLDDWYRGRTSFGIAVPSYTDITSLEDLNGSDVNEILGIEPGAAIMQKIPDSVMLAYDLEQVLVQASTPGNAPRGRQPLREPGGVHFIAWSSHWMNQQYDYRYLDDPPDAPGRAERPGPDNVDREQRFP